MLDHYHNIYSRSYRDEEHGHLIINLPILSPPYMRTFLELLTLFNNLDIYKMNLM